RHPRHAPVDEFVRYHVADDGDGPAPQRADKGEELRRIHPTASIKLLRIASGSRRPGGASVPPELCPDLTSTERTPAAWPLATSIGRSPTMNDRDRSSPNSAAACSIMPGSGLRHRQTCRYSGSGASG